MKRSEYRGGAPFRSETKDDRQHCEQADQGIKLILSDVIRLNAKRRHWIACNSRRNPRNPMNNLVEEWLRRNVTPHDPTESICDSHI
jgi:hypothetical protein